MKRTLLLLAALAPLALADQVYNVTLDTSGLGGSLLAPFRLDFQLTDGDGISNNNRVTLSNFQFGLGGSSTGGGIALGGASGALASSVVLRDTAFLNTFTEGFTPGSVLNFQLATTTNYGGITPDQFNFAILDQFGNFLPTSYFDVFVTIDINGVPPALFTGSNALTGNPSVTPVFVPTGVPEPGTWMTLGAGGMILSFLRRRKKP